MTITAHEYLGFRPRGGSTMLARTLMLTELTTLFEYVEKPHASNEDFRAAIIEENCLSKRSGRSRTLSARHLSELYGLDSRYLLFRALTWFWRRDESARPQLALLAAYARDELLRNSAVPVLALREGDLAKRESMQVFLEEQYPGRYSPATLKSAAQNISASWTQAGVLNGRVKKTRRSLVPSVAALAYALLLSYASGVRGEELLVSEYVKLLDCNRSQALELAERASQKGWLVLKRIGTVIEVQFPNLITEQDMEWIREQS